METDVIVSRSDRFSPEVGEDRRERACLRGAIFRVTLNWWQEQLGSPREPSDYNVETDACPVAVRYWHVGPFLVRRVCSGLSSNRAGQWTQKGRIGIFGGTVGRE